MATKRTKGSETKAARPMPVRAVAARAAAAPVRSTKALRKPEAPMIARSNGQPTHDEIARRAYELFEQRGFSHGCDLDDWLRAESELIQR